MSDLVGNPEDRFSCVAAQIAESILDELCIRKPSVFPTRSDTNQAVQLKNHQAGSFKFWN